MKRERPMLWVFPEYGGQLAVRFGDYKVVKQGVKTPRRSSPWEVYYLATDRGEKNDLASQRPDLVAQAKQILNEQISENTLFPMSVPD